MFESFNNMKVGTKILVICLFLAIVPVLSIGLVAYSSSSGVINEEIETLLQTQVGDMKGWTNDVYELTINKVNSDLNVLRQNFNRQGTPAIIDGKLTLIDSEGDEYIVNGNFEIVDLVQDLVGGTATVFQVFGDEDAVRISTNVIGTDGTRAVGTRLQDNVYDVVVDQGDTYYGKRNLFGIDYVTAYEPIKDSSGNVVGILYVGTEKAETLDVVKNSIRETVIGENGYMYVIDSEGNVLMHPSLEGENLANEDYIQEMLKNREGGIIPHQVDGTNVLEAYTYYEPLDWYIVSRAVNSDFNAPIDTIRNTIVIVVIASICICAVIAILFGRSISDPLQQVVLMLKDLRNGHLSTRLNIRRKDEIGVMATTMDEFAEDLQTNIVGNIRKIAKGEYIQDISVTDELDEIRPALKMMLMSFDHLHKETIKLTDAARAGDLSVRGDESAFKGGYRMIIAGFNRTLETITEPVNEAMRLARYYASGDFTARFDEKIPVAGEFVAYRDALNTIGIELQRLMKLITEELYEGVSVLSSASTEILTVTSQLSSASLQTATTVNATSDTVELVRKKTDLVNQKTQSVSDKAMKAIQVSGDGRKSVQEILDGMNQIQKEMDMIGMNVIKLSEQSQAVGEIIATVTDISEQSNLLAVNASIEAAKAGELGRGFSVVAHEIHDLAEQSKQATTKIRTILTDIQRGVSSTVISTEQGTKTVADAARLTRDAREAIEVLTRSIADSSREAIESASSIQEQVAGMDQISIAMENIRDAAQKNLEMTRIVEKTSEDLHELGIRLKNITVQYHV